MSFHLQSAVRPLQFLLLSGAVLLGTSLSGLAADKEKGYECRWAPTPPVIDGKIDDPVWKNAEVIESFTTHWLPEGQRTPPTHTKARLLWDREYLYFCAEMEDTDVFSNVTEQDGTIWMTDVFELFFKPAKDKLGYYEFEVNASNAKLDMFLPSRGSGGYYRHARDRDFHIESAVQIHGTLNDWTDKDEGWTVEGRIPWRDFLPTGGRPAPGEIWMNALCRYDYSVGFEEPALSSTAPLTKPNFHRYEDYVPCKFVGPKDGTQTQRIEWKTSRLVGSPDAPLPFRAEPAFPKLNPKQPITVVPEPGKNTFLLLECNGYEPIRKSRLSRFSNNAEVTKSETLLRLDETIYDLCFHPRFAENGYIYIGANGRYGPGVMDFNDRLLRYTMDPSTGKIDPASRQLLIEWRSHGHNGQALRFGKDGMLYITSGDGTSESDEWNTAQDLTLLNSKLLRIDVDHPSGGKPYGIPSDNPFLQMKDVRPETWAYGFRNPWRMSIDLPTGDIWVGENGQDLWEYARIAHRGENYGWPLVEGSHPYQQNRKSGPTPISKPLIEHPHTDFRSLTGGFVYRGSKYPELVGHYIYGDHSTGQIWAALQRDGKLIEDKRLAITTMGITCFCESPQGDILVVDYLGNAIQKLEHTPKGGKGPLFPDKLSETGLFVDTASLKPDPALLPYEINAPAWHDGATAERYIALPGNTTMEFTEQSGWNFPNGAAVVQTLSANQKRLETRVLLRQNNEWNAYSYVWNDQQTDATRAPTEGLNLPDRRVPGRQECIFCHSRTGNYVLSASTVQLNRPGKSGENQIAQWERLGLLTYNDAKAEESQWRREFGAQKLGDVALREHLNFVVPMESQRAPAKTSPLLPRPADTFLHLVNPYDEGAPLVDRVRSYLHANCSQCHVHSGGGNSNMQLASNVAEKDMAVVDAFPLHTTFGIPDARIICPGAPERSMMLYRLAVRGAGQMPPVGTSKTDGAGVALLAKWIAALKSMTASK